MKTDKKDTDEVWYPMSFILPPPPKDIQALLDAILSKTKGLDELWLLQFTKDQLETYLHKLFDAGLFDGSY